MLITVTDMNCSELLKKTPPPDRSLTACVKKFTAMSMVLAHHDYLMIIQPSHI